MDRCDNCNVRGLESPLFTRMTVVEGETVCLLFCRKCQQLSNEDLRRKIEMLAPPFDKRVLGVGS